MEEVTRTNYEVMRFRAVAEAWQRTAKKDDPFTSFVYAIGRVLKSTERLAADYQQSVTGVNIECSSKDDKGNLLNDARGAAMFTPELCIDRLKRVRVIDDKRVTVSVYFAKSWPDDLNQSQIFAFEGFVIPEPEEPVEKASNDALAV